MNAEECQFSVQFPVKQEALIWSDKYRPRKPRFFNRVHTVCFSWCTCLLPTPEVDLSGMEGCDLISCCFHVLLVLLFSHFQFLVFFLVVVYASVSQAIG